MTIRSTAILALLVAGTASGCKDDPPPPPVPTAAPLASASASASAAVPVQVPRISADTMRRYRVETCLFGVQGLYVLRDAYTSSVGDAGPSADNLPSFGEYPDQKRLLGRGKGGDDGAATPTGSASAAPAGSAAAGASPSGSAPARKPGFKANPRLAQRRALAAVRQIPFLRYLRSCQIAKRPDPKNDALDAATKEFDAYVAPLNALLLEATRYYSAERYQTDDFKRGKAIHERLLEELPKLDEKLAAMQKAADAYEGTRPADPPEPLGAAGKAGRATVAAARAATVLVLAKEVDRDALGAAIKKLEEASSALAKAGEADALAAHPKLLAEPAEHLVAALEEIAASEGAPTLAQRYAATSAMTALLENEQRAISQLLRRKGGRKAGGIRVPHNRLGGMAPLRPRLRPKEGQ